jgi:hypothetical protein
VQLVGVVDGSLGTLMEHKSHRNWQYPAESSSQEFREGSRKKWQFIYSGPGWPSQHLNRRILHIRRLRQNLGSLSSSGLIKNGTDHLSELVETESWSNEFIGKSQENKKVRNRQADVESKWHSAVSKSPSTVDIWLRYFG